MVKKILRFFSIESDMDDVETIHTTITNGSIFRGTNIWILVFAVIIASVGLNMNSTAVIIGAMLISPLMGPINGIGYSIATYDFPLLRRALKNFAFAVGSSLAASTLYFLITPLSVAHSELLARTSPTIYDVIIALVGGMAGVLAISSKHKGNVITGVAIATALMPPLCTAGYGLATGQFIYFFGAFYLFTINTVFIAISSVLFSQVLNFPIRTIVEPGKKKHVTRVVTLVIMITIVPSIYFGYLLVQKERFTERATKFIAGVSAINGSYLLKYETDPNRRRIKLVYGGSTPDSETKNKIAAQAIAFGLDTTGLSFEQGFAIDKNPSPLNESNSDMQAEISRLRFALTKAEQKNRDTLEVHRKTNQRVLNEAKLLFPTVKNFGWSYAEMADAESFSGNDRRPVLIFSVAKPGLPRKDKKRLEGWIAKRLGLDNAFVHYELY
jgi:uncharacterized hydrophobic protein (TIGR00271 family)